MYNYTNYTLFFITELKYRFFYILLNFIVIIIYCIVFINDFLLYLLKPLEYSNFDLEYGSFSTILFFLLNNWNDMDVISINEITIKFFDSTYTKYDYFPSLEINSKSGTTLYICLIEYYLLLYGIPIIMYQFYLFLYPGFFYYENSQMRTKIILIFLIINLIYKYFHWWLILLFLIYSFNTYHEFFHYEFDIEFDVISFIKYNVLILFLSYVNILFILVNIHKLYNSYLCKYTYIIFNLYVCKYVLVFFFYLIIYYIFTWCHFFYKSFFFIY